MTLTDARRELRAARLAHIKGLGRWANFMLGRDIGEGMLRRKRLRYEQAKKRVEELELKSA